ncbi:hypothetical protein CALCODRAFT_169766 [Calocera cornea HHB12733]|uniref:Uncharacterized protein n=1 Tax=Calocera cornea HHB12733 TaxID=1353952 RepID=A0A165CGE2_9BASI|nr:hypothetical protein CALCODRAFT_169766 [Calocera cornea HHB12733]
MDPSQQQPPYSASASPYSHPSSPSPPPVPFPGLASSLAWLAGAPGLPFPQGAFLLIPLQGVTAPATAFPTWAGAQVIPATPSTTNVHTPEQPLQPTVAPGSWPETPLASPMPSTANLHTSVQPLKPTAAPGSLEEALLTPPKPITESVHITALPSKTTAASDHPGGLQKSCAAWYAVIALSRIRATPNEGISRKAHVTCDGVQPLCGQCAVLGLVQCCRGRGRPPGSGRRRTSVRSPVQQGVRSVV